MVKLFWTRDEDEETSIKIQNIESDYSDEDFVEEVEVWQIALDVLENHESVYILAPVAWVELDDIDISVHETTLTISWVRNKPEEFYKHEMQIKNSECFWGKFLRNVILSENMDFSQIKAVMENNLLVIYIPKIRFDSQNIKINRISS